MSRSAPIVLTLMLVPLLAGCASYTPQPLTTTLPLVVLTDAASIDRPFLKPVTIDLAAPLDDNAIAVIAVIANPDLKAQRLKAGVADAQAFSARLLPDPTFTSGFGKLLGGPDPLNEVAGGLGLDINALRTGKVKRASAQALAQQARLDLAWAEWQTAGQARLQAARIRRLSRSIALLSVDRDASNLLLDHNLHAAARGDVADGAVQAARADSVATQDKLTVVERDLQAAKLELLKLLGLSPTTILRLADQTATDTPIDAEALSRRAVDNRADLQALRAGYVSQEAGLYKAVLDQFPNLALNLNFTRDTSDNRILGPTVDFTLPLWNRNRGGIAVERATRDQLKAEYEARLFQTRADIAAAAAAVVVARRQRDAVRVQLPEFRRIARVSRKAADAGDLSHATAIAAEGALNDKAVELATAEQTIDETMIALELMTGVPKEDW